MKSFLILLIFLNAVFNLNAQQKSEIIPLVENIIQNSIDKDYAAVIAQTYPKLFANFPHDIILEVIEASFDNEEFIIDIHPTEFNIEISDIKEINNGQYALVQYNLKSSLKFHYYINSEIDNYANVIKELMPDAKVEFDRKTQSFIIFKRSRSLAISDEFTNGTWKFLNVDEFNYNLLSLLLDQKILNAFDL